MQGCEVSPRITTKFSKGGGVILTFSLFLEALNRIRCSIIPRSSLRLLRPFADVITSSLPVSSTSNPAIFAITSNSFRSYNVS
ncbi:hypothetical protein HK096_008810 [Nowakowskiella sp. JEL0078]|nr:hypothetical protein HK096_008810 [Nowakowskiella sp. JEL0078]